MKHRHGREVKRIAGGGFVGADAAFAKDDLIVAACHDVFGGHKEFFDGVGQTALEQNGLIGAAEFLEHFEILHAAGTDLNDVDVFEERQMRDAHDFSDDGQPCGFAGLEEQVKPFASEPLEIVGRRTRLEGAAAEHCGASGFHGFGDADDLLFGFNRAGTGNHGEVAAAHLGAARFDDRVLRMEEAVGEFAGVTYAANGFNRRKRQNLVGGQMQAGFADDADGCFFLPLHDDSTKPSGFKTVLKIGDVGRCGGGLHDDDHGFSPEE